MSAGWGCEDAVDGGWGVAGSELVEGSVFVGGMIAEVEQLNCLLDRRERVLLTTTPSRRSGPSYAVSAFTPRLGWRASTRKR
jgi:hypothetical protein